MSTGGSPIGTGQFVLLLAPTAGDVIFTGVLREVLLVAAALLLRNALAGVRVTGTSRSSEVGS